MQSTFHSMEFLEICSGEWNSIFPNFLKIGKPCEVYPKLLEISYWKFLFHFTFLSEFKRTFSQLVHFSEAQQYLEFGNFQIFGNLYQLSQFQNVWSNGKCSQPVKHSLNTVPILVMFTLLIKPQTHTFRPRDVEENQEGNKREFPIKT